MQRSHNNVMNAKKEHKNAQIHLSLSLVSHKATNAKERWERRGTMEVSTNDSWIRFLFSDLDLNLGVSRGGTTQNGGFSYPEALKLWGRKTPFIGQKDLPVGHVRWILDIQPATSYLGL